MALGAAMAERMMALKHYPALMLDGGLGAGKTTFVRGMVQALPNGDQAEVASPSFNYMNNYPTIPETFHFDFYRLRDLGPDEELINALHDPVNLVIVEWAAYCHPRHRPSDHLTLQFTVVPEGRHVAIIAHGGQAARVMYQFSNILPPGFQSREVMQGEFITCGS